MTKNILCYSWRKKLSYVVWGTGKRGTNIYKYIKTEVKAFIESDKRKVGQDFDGIPIISFENYRELYKDYLIIVSPYNDDEIIKMLNFYQINSYIRSNDCPIEFVDNYYPELIDKVNRALNGQSVNIIGVTFLGIWLARELTRLNYKVILVDLDNSNLEIIDKICEREITFQSFTECSKQNEETTIVVSSRKNEYITEKILNNEWIDLFHLAEFLPDCYRNMQICQFKELYKGQRCFVVATGPSIKISDLDILADNNEKCFSMNKIFYSFNETKWRPDFYVGEDSNLIEHYSEYLKKVDTIKFLSDSYEYQKDENEECYTFHLSMPLDGTRPSGADDFSWGYSCGFSVIFGCLYLAMYMGFSEIYIIGADLNYSNNMSDARNHFYGDKDTVSAANAAVCLPFHYESVLANYEYIAKMASKKGIAIYNATRGGELECFTRISFDELLDK